LEAADVTRNPHCHTHLLPAPAAAELREEQQINNNAKLRFFVTSELTAAPVSEEEIILCRKFLATNCEAQILG